MFSLVYRNDSSNWFRRLMLVIVSFLPWVIGFSMLSYDGYRPLTKLMEAVDSDQTDEVKSLIAKGADVNETAAYGWTALWVAANKGNVEMARLLLQAGAQANQSDDLWQSYPLMAAVSWVNNLYIKPRPSLEIVQLLLESGADVNARRPDGESSLHWAATFGRLDLAKLLIDAGADVNATTCVGETPLMRAALKDVEMVKLLVDAGASPTARTSAGYTAFDQANFQPEKTQAIVAALKQAKTTTLPPAYQGAACSVPWHARKMKRWGDQHLLPMSYEGWARVNSFSLGFLFLPSLLLFVFALLTRDKPLMVVAAISPFAIAPLSFAFLMFALSGS